jgi:hypothetical protein
VCACLYRLLMRLLYLWTQAIADPNPACVHVGVHNYIRVANLVFNILNSFWAVKVISPLQQFQLRTASQVDVKDVIIRTLSAHQHAEGCVRAACRSCTGSFLARRGRGRGSRRRTRENRAGE